MLQTNVRTDQFLSFVNNFITNIRAIDSVVDVVASRLTSVTSAEAATCSGTRILCWWECQGPLINHYCNPYDYQICVWQTYYERYEKPWPAAGGCINECTVSQCYKVKGSCYGYSDPSRC